MRFLLLLSAIGAAANAGPISKFDQRKPVAEYSSSAGLYDVERCLLDMDNQGVPMVYRQPDHPGRSTLIWFDHAKADSRVDLEKQGNKTLIRTWNGAKQVRRCAL